LNPQADGFVTGVERSTEEAARLYGARHFGTNSLFGTDSPAGSISLEADFMYCPKCGKENPEQQKFCTSCGLRLAAISTAIANESQTAGEKTIATLSGGSKGWRAPLIYAFLLIGIGALISVFGNEILRDKSLGDIGTLVSLVGVLVILLKGLLLVVQSNAPTAGSGIPADPEVEHNRQQARVQAANAPALLSAEPPSITEHTTRQLESNTPDEPERPRTTQPTLQ